jgi:hypothetical protein
VPGRDRREGFVENVWLSSLAGVPHRHNRLVPTVARIRFWLILFVIGLLISGVTA